MKPEPLVADERLRVEIASCSATASRGKMAWLMARASRTHGGSAPPEPGAGLWGLRSANCSIRRRLSSSTVLGTTTLRTTKRSPVGLILRSRHALAPEPELLAAGAAGRDGQRLQAVERGHVDLGPEDRLGDGDRHLDREVAAVAGEIGVRLDRDRDGQVARRAPSGRARPGP